MCDVVIIPAINAVVVGSIFTGRKLLTYVHSVNKILLHLTRNVPKIGPKMEDGVPTSKNK